MVIPKIRHVLIEKLRPEAIFLDLISSGLHAIYDTGYPNASNCIYLFSGDKCLFKFNEERQYLLCSRQLVWKTMTIHGGTYEYRNIRELIKIMAIKHLKINILDADWTDDF